MAYIGKVPTAVPLTSADIQDGTIALADLSATGTKDSTTFLRGDNTFASAGGTNTPAWKVKRGSAQSGVANATETTIICDSEEFDTANAYNTSTGIFTVPSGQGGKYMIGGAFRTNASGTGTRVIIYINVAGSNVHQYNNPQSSDGEASSGIHAIVSLTAGQEVKLRVYQNTGGAVNLESSEGKTYFYGYKIIE